MPGFPVEQFAPPEVMLPYEEQALRIPNRVSAEGKYRAPTTYADRAFQKSQFASATRKALGPNWYTGSHLDDEPKSYNVPCASSVRVNRSQRDEPIPDRYLKEFNEMMYGDDGDEWQNEEPIPDKYLQEYNRLWWEDDEDNDADQLMADMSPNAHAPWRRHLPLRPMYGPGAAFDTSIRYEDRAETSGRDSRRHEGAGTHRPKERAPTPAPRPVRVSHDSVTSTFDWSVEEEPPRSFGKRLRRGLGEALGRLCS